MISGGRSTFAANVIAILLLSIGLRIAWLQSDPPTFSPIGIIWHDEGAWVHNARNRALWGVWRTDAWNPVFVTPVFTALEYGAFTTLGVGTWQARTVPVASGLVAIAALMAGLAALAGRRAALVGGLLLGANYVFVMWNRAALIESTMTTFLVVGWAAYARAARAPAWGLLAGSAAVLAWFTKASAAFFVGAIAIDALVSLFDRAGDRTDRRAALFVAVGGVATALAIAVLFVAPYWNEYRFYNWQMSVLRKPEFTIAAFVDRASWLPLVQGVFARMWPVLVVATISLLTIAAGGVRSRPAERLLVLWVVLGVAELVVHDSGNERRYLMFVPALVALAARAVTSSSALLPDRLANAGPWARAAGAVLLLVLGYLVVGSAFRILLHAEITGGLLSTSVRSSAAVAILLTAIVLLSWSRTVRGLASRTMPAPAAWLLIVTALAWNVPDYAGWIRHLTQMNHDASVALGKVLPPETPVHGKLANGLALENRIRPVFVGNGFGNYADRLQRDDIRYLLTYDLPRIGYESSDGSGLIEGILERYPDRRVIATFDVDETPEPERAALIDKQPVVAAQVAP